MEESQNSLNFRMYRALFMKQYQTSNEQASPEYKKCYQVLDNLSKRIDDNNKGIHVVESKRQIYKNFVCYNDLYQKFLISNYDNLHEYGLYERNIKPYELVLKDLEQKYKISKNKTRNARGNGPMNKIEYIPKLTNSAMAEYNAQMNKERVKFIKQNNSKKTRRSKSKRSRSMTRNMTRNPLMSNSFNTKVRL
jgi:hypothetical protein